MMSIEDIFFQWSPEYSVNIREIDEQHKELVRILNRLFVAVSLREGDKVIAGILDALVSYTRTHFALEERLMRLAGYKGVEAHVLEHAKLIEQLDQLCQKYIRDEKSIHFEMLSFLKSWLREHILEVDSKYSSDLQKAGFSVVAWEREAAAEFGTMLRAKKWWEIWKTK